jgi:hypothetical protein
MFKLIRVKDISGTVEEKTVSDSEVDIYPQRKYLYDEEDPTDHRRRIQFGQYFESELQCRFICDYTTYKLIIAFLNESDLVNDLDIGLGLYIWFTDSEGNVHGYPIFQIIELPEIANDARYFNREYKFTLKSIYIANPHLPDILDYGDGDYGDGYYGY